MKLIDLTLELYDGLQSFKSHPPFEIKEHSTFENSGHRYISPCKGFESRLITFSDHSGTHIDAPVHFIEGGETASDMTLDNTMGEAVFLDVSDFKSQDEAVTDAMMKSAEEKQGIQVRENDIVLVRTRKGTWGDENFDEAKSFAKSAGEWLTNKKVKTVGLDLPNIDVNDNMKREVHMEVLGKNMYIVENLINLEKLPKQRRFQFQALPIKMKNATASPVRAIAFVDEF
ncbi:cyclase family protein [Virgibacillus sp. NKC19-3]|uniref:cyclase family protein n=1 Tax=Virgibacillus saliphilus TaxID=2831674 RepID=UPI001C9B204F|nr:cyclase family protein [Virgibacillus sp. NKC19-3]MBY7144536.1 cyclase family protein [Virgibacillus sp. NKC19-3]